MLLLLFASVVLHRPRVPEHLAVVYTFVNSACRAGSSLSDDAKAPVRAGTVADSWVGRLTNKTVVTTALDGHSCGLSFIYLALSLDALEGIASDFILSKRCLLIQIASANIVLSLLTVSMARVVISD